MANSETTNTTTNNEAVPTRDASDVYDRQIRLWGAEAQVCYYFICLTIYLFMTHCIVSCWFDDSSSDFLERNCVHTCDL